MRIGNGFDVHKLVEGRPLYLCGMEIPFAKGLLGHSDADVALHALCDALLGAAALGDIGQLYPDNDPQYAGIRSTVLLEDVMRRLRCRGYELVNLDLTMIAEAPKLAPYRERMRENLAVLLNCSLEQVSIKATTTEKLGFTGRGEGIACQAAVLIRQSRA